MKSLIPFLLGVLVGAGAGFLVTRQILDKKYADIVEEEISSIREAAERAKERKTFISVERPVSQELADMLAKDDAEHEKLIKNNPMSAVVRSSLDSDPNEVAKREYFRMAKKYMDEKLDKEEGIVHEPDVDPDEDEEEDPEPRDAAGYSEQDNRDLSRVDRTQPYIIDDEEYAEGYNNHDQVSLYYYRADDVLAEENQETLDDIENTIGYDALKALDMQTTIWVRNERLGIDYEVIALNGSYAETAHGIRNHNRIMTPRERYEEREKKRRLNNDGE